MIIEIIFISVDDLHLSELLQRQYSRDEFFADNDFETMAARDISEMEDQQVL